MKLRDPKFPKTSTHFAVRRVERKDEIEVFDDIS